MQLPIFQLLTGKGDFLHQSPTGEKKSAGTKKEDSEETLPPSENILDTGFRKTKLLNKQKFLIALVQGGKQQLKQQLRI